MIKLMHIQLEEDLNVRYCILPGDPGRCDKIAEMLDKPSLLAYNREYKTYMAEIEGEKVLVTSTGIGGPSAAIAVEELYQTGVREFIRVGTAGGMHKKVMPGDLVIASAAVREEGTSLHYLPIEFPAVADFDLITALHKAAKELDFNDHIGVVQSKDSFYGQHSPERMPVAAELLYKWNAYIAGGCLASEMECAALFTVTSCLEGAKAAAVLTTLWNQEREKEGIKEDAHLDSTAAIKTAIEAIKLRIKENQ